MAKDDPARAARLAAALRTNLHRRKAQARAQEGGEGEPQRPPNATRAPGQMVRGAPGE